MTQHQLDLVATVGLAVCWGAVALAWLAGAGRGILYFPIYLVLLEFKIHTEERLMLAEFPEDYPRYRRRVPQLVPGLRLAGRHRVASG